MSRAHLYNSKLGKVRWFIARFGAREVLLKPLRVIFSPVIISTLRPANFKFKGAELNLFYHRYNMTWASERCVEVPIARYFAQKVSPLKTLEVGNVLSHYGLVEHDILDKFEKAPGVMNGDITKFRPQKKYDLIISISTFEHIGFDDEAEGNSATKIQEAIQVCRALLSPNGLLIITVPMGYNPFLNRLIQCEELGASAQTFLRKTGTYQWSECSKTEALECKYKEPYPYANSVMIAEFQAAY